MIRTDKEAQLMNSSASSLTGQQVLIPPDSLEETSRGRTNAAATVADGLTLSGFFPPCPPQTDFYPTVSGMGSGHPNWEAGIVY